MGKRPRKRPLLIGEKLLKIRMEAGLTQAEVCRRLGLDIPATAISIYESGLREPSLITILAYARLAGISTDVLIDDELELPSILPQYGR